MNDEIIYKMKVLAVHLRVLVVVDNLEISNELKEVLDYFFFKVDVSSDGLDALILYKRNRYDIVIINTNVQYIGEKELSNKIKSINENQIIIFLSDFLDINAMLPKSFKLENLFMELLKFSQDILLNNNLKETNIQNKITKLNLENEYKKVFISNYTYFYKGKVDVNNKLETIFSNIKQLNKQYAKTINQIQSNYYGNDAIKTIASIFNGYYQNFGLIKETNTLAKTFLKISTILYKSDFDNNTFDDFRIQIIVGFLYVEIINLQNEIFVKNKKENINYLKTTFENSISLVLNKLEINNKNELYYKKRVNHGCL